MLGCEDDRRSAAERLNSSQSVRAPTSPHSASSIVAAPLSVSRLQQSNLPRRTPPLFQDPHIHYHSFISAGPTFMSSPRTGSRSRLRKLQPGGRQKQTAPQESPLPSRAHANPGHSEGSTHSITLGCSVVGSSETRTGDGSASAGRWTGWPPDCCLSCRPPKSRPVPFWTPPSRKGGLTCLPKWRPFQEIQLRW